MLPITTQMLAPLGLSARESRLSAKLDLAQDLAEKVQTLIARLEHRLDKFGIAPQHMLDRIDAILLRADALVDRVEDRTSGALSTQIDDLRLVIDAGRSSIAETVATVPGRKFVDWDAFEQVQSAVNRLERIEDIAMERLDNLIDRIERTDSRNLYDEFDARLERLTARLDAIDEALGARFDARLDALHDRLSARASDVEALRSGLDVPSHAPDPDPTPTYTAEYFQGEGETVVVIDSGWNTQFIGDYETIQFDYDFYASGDGNARVSHANDHGSWVDQVVRGVASMANVIHLKVFSDTGGSASALDILEALTWAVNNVETYNITSVNLSLGSGNMQDYVSNHFFGDEYQALADRGVLTVVAAGNSGQYGMNYVAADRNAIAVSASTSANTKANFTQHHEEMTDIFAFGSGVRIEDEFGGANRVSGTSFSAPYVAGVAARVQQAAEEIIDRHLTQDEFVFLLQQSGRDLVGYDGDADGYKVADADLAVQYFIDHYTDFV